MSESMKSPFPFFQRGSCGTAGEAMARDAGIPDKPQLQFPIQLPVLMHLGKPRQKVQAAWAPATQSGRPGWSSWLHLGPALALEAIWRVNQWTADLCPILSARRPFK